jgi:uncharacterized protein (UPF0332 family)
MIRAVSCLETADFLYSSKTPAQSELRPDFLRTVITKAYYSIHHSLRAIAIMENEWEADGHQESISELRRLLKDIDFQKRSGLTDAVIAELAQARDNRSVADYSPYDHSRREVKTNENSALTQMPASDIAKRDTKVDWVSISDGDWEKAAKFNIDLAQRLLKAADAVWKGK